MKDSSRNNRYHFVDKCYVIDVNSLIAAAIAILLLSATNAQCTVHLVYYDRSAVYVGSDTLRTIDHSGVFHVPTTITACKIESENGIILTLSGLTFNAHVIKHGNKPQTVVVDHKFHPIAAAILSKNESLDSKLDDLMTASTVHLRLMMKLHPEDANTPSRSSYKLGGTMIAFVDGHPRVWSFVTEVVDWKKGPERPKLLD